MLQIILAGQPELDRKLEDRDFRQLKQRSRCAAVYARSRRRKRRNTSRPVWRGPGCASRPCFPPDVVIEIHRRTQGIPRLINSVCDNLLLTSFAMESKVSSLEMLDEVSRDLRLDWPGSSRFYAEEESGAVI